MWIRSYINRFCITKSIILSFIRIGVTIHLLCRPFFKKTFQIFTAVKIEVVVF